MTRLVASGATQVAHIHADSEKQTPEAEQGGRLSGVASSVPLSLIHEGKDHTDTILPLEFSPILSEQCTF